MSSIVTQLAGAKAGVDQLNASGVKVPGMQDLFPNAQTPGSGIVNAATQGQADQLYGQQQAGLGQQQAFTNAVSAAYQGLPQQQMALNQQLQGVANGQGPNPAQAMLNQATSANTANQASLMAGQRGSGANPALIARQAAMQGGANQQQAASQGATMQANQSLAALNQMGQQQNAMMGQQQGALNANQQGIGSAQQNILGAIGNQNNANVNYAGVGAGVDLANAKKNNALAGSVMNGIGSAVGMFAEGGGVPVGDSSGAANMMNSLSAGMDDPFKREKKDKKPGEASTPDPSSGVNPETAATMSPFADGGSVAGPRSRVGQHFHGIKPQPQMQQPIMMAEGGKVPALLSPGERYLAPEQVEKVAQGADPIKASKKVPGTPRVGGSKNSYANDTVKATLDEGGIVLPRSVTQAKHPHWAAKKFVEGIMAQQSLKGKK